MGISWQHLLIVLLIALVVFGAKKLRTIGSDLGAAVKGFKKAMNEGDTDEQIKQLRHDEDDADFASGESSKRSADAKTGTDRKT
jgi:sec-independent protein translocase protein TatA